MKFPGHLISKCINITKKDIPEFRIEDSFNFGIQLTAINEFIEQGLKFIQQKEIEIESSEKRFNGSNESSSYVADLHWESTYWDSAYSLAAIGQISPFIESLLTVFFRQYWNTLSKKVSHPRLLKSNEKSHNPHYFFENNKFSDNFVKGTIQLVEIFGLSEKFPEHFALTVEAIIKYRNAMFHNGFEWPKSESVKFSNFLKDKRIPEKWFDIATSGESPWCYFMTTCFITHLLSFSENILQILCEILDDIQPDIESFTDTLLPSLEIKGISQ